MMYTAYAICVNQMEKLIFVGIKKAMPRKVKYSVPVLIHQGRCRSGFCANADQSDQLEVNRGTADG